MRISIGKGIAKMLLLTALLILTASLGTPADAAQIKEPEEGAAQPTRLTLAQVIDLTLRANRTVVGSGYGVEGRRYGLDAAQSEFEWKYAPSTTATLAEEERLFGVGLSLQKKFATGPRASVTPQAVQSSGPDNDDTLKGRVEVGLTIPLLRGWGREVNMNAVDSAEYSLRSTERSFHLVKVDAVLEAVAAVFAIIEQEELVNLNRQQTQSFESHVVMAAAKEKIGLASPMDLYRARIRLKDAQERLSRALEAVQSARDRLKLILALPLEKSLSVTAPVTYVPLEISVEEALRTAFKHRVELEQADDDLKEEQRACRVARHNLRPQLDLVGRYNHYGAGALLENGLDPEEDYWSVSLVSTTDWRRTSEKSSYRRALLTVKTAELNRWTLNDNIRRQVRQNYEAIFKAEERMRIRKEQIRQAEGKLALAQVQFNHGMADNFDVIEAQTELQSAKTNLLAAEIEHIVGRYHLRAAMGTLIEYRENDPTD